VSKAVCPVCNIPLIGRTDKKYCSDQCRYIANNKIKQKHEQPLLEVNSRLRKNRSILKNLCPEGRAIVRKDILDTMEYDYNLFSSIYVNPKRQIYYICYDYAFTPIVEHEVKKAFIVARHNFVNSWDPWKFIRKDP
jgi:predicted nucleic acid-binding Zn ribbon protein